MPLLTVITSVSITSLALPVGRHYGIEAALNRHRERFIADSTHVYVVSGPAAPDSQVLVCQV